MGSLGHFPTTGTVVVPQAWKTYPGVLPGDVDCIALGDFPARKIRVQTGGAVVLTWNNNGTLVDDTITLSDGGEWIGDIYKVKSSGTTAQGITVAW